MSQFIAPRRRKRRLRNVFLVVFIFTVLATVLGALGWSMLAPNKEHITPSYGSDKPIFYEGKLAETGAKGNGESLLVPLTVLQELIDSNIMYEKDTNSIIITTENRVVRLQSEQLDAWVNDKPFQLRFPAADVDGELYVPIEPLERFYGVRFAEAEDTGIVTLRKPNDVITWLAAPAAEDGKTLQIPVRLEPSIKSPIVSEVRSGGRAAVWGETDGWYYVQLANGHVGFAEKKHLEYSGVETVSAPASEEPANGYVPKRPMGEKVVLTWEQVYTKTPDPSRFGPMEGLNVVSPTWFHLLNAEGALENRGADPAYVSWAHNRGYQVWALFTNRFDPELTAQALSTYDRRMNMARQLVSWSKLYKLDGINIDFENVNVEDGPLLTQFVRELTPLLHEAGATVSIDVTFAGGSANWSRFLDRKALAEAVDYMMVMAYDEHWASSPKAGSVASLPWVERGVKALLEEHGVPRQKLVLGIPFYTRIWTEETIDGKTKVSSKAVGMEAVQNLISEKKLTPAMDHESGQHYVEFKENNTVKKIWIEDETSVKARVELALKYDLAGIAAWSRGFERPTVWQTIQGTLQSSYK
ncbi:glycosyl hydrolase family 18 protein [Paenibacillus thermotolerans]|uniref:glycosyl hydrolase family 18 protein n=1 Tax=Paenibacillus thermotolerans TaxID=3027807 RepID=UPI002367CE99|nr:MULTISPECIES: glycosyl hydrolase family 18 protein [unclassified Paenibacillus]